MLALQKTSLSENTNPYKPRFSELYWVLLGIIRLVRGRRARVDCVEGVNRYSSKNI